MSDSTDAARMDALERHAAMMSEGRVQAIDHIRALTIVTATVLAACSDQDRAEIRAAALGSLGDAPEDVRLRALIEQVTPNVTEPGGSTVGISAALADVPARLN